jgi:hypothetical protein
MEIEERTKKRIDEGAYWEALGLAPGADRLTIDKTAARLSRACPDLASDISGITQSIRTEEKRPFYEIACNFRDAVYGQLLRRFGSDFLRQAPSCRAFIWSQCQRLLRCDFKKADVRIMPNGAASLARRGEEWIIESVVNAYLPLIDEASGRGGRQSRRITFSDVTCLKCGNSRQVACPSCDGTGRISSGSDLGEVCVITDDPTSIIDKIAAIPCVDCGGSGTELCDCQDEYSFEIRPDTAAGTVLRGVGKRTGRKLYVIWKRKVVAPRPNMAIEVVYRCFGMSAAGMECDWSLEEMESILKYSFKASGAFMILVSCLVGLLFGAWQAGVATGIVGSLFAAGLSRSRFRPRANKALRYLALPAVLATGCLTALLFGPWQPGLWVGLVLAAVAVLISFACAAFQRRVAA